MSVDSGFQSYDRSLSDTMEGFLDLFRDLKGGAHRSLGGLDIQADGPPAGQAIPQGSTS